MTDPQAVAAPRTSAGRALVEDEPRLVTGEHSMLVRVLAIEAEAIEEGMLRQLERQLHEEQNPGRSVVLGRPTAPSEPLRAALHRLLMPPHPGNVYVQSALCSCGKWQWDSDTTLLDYRAVLRDHTLHALQASPQPESPDHE